MRWRNIGLLTVALLALGNAVTSGQEKAKAVVEKDKSKVDPQERDSDEKQLLKRQMEDLVLIRKQFEKQADESQKILTWVRADLFTFTGLRDSKVLNEIVGPLQIDVQRLRMEEVGMTARKEALEAMIAKAAKEGRDLVVSDPIARELTKLVSLREESLEALRKDAHDARTVAMAQLIETRIKLEERLALLRSGTIGNAKLTERLMETTIALAESQARLKQSEAFLAKLRSPTVDQLLAQEKKATADLAIVQQELFELQKTGHKLFMQARELEKKPAK